MKGNNHLLAGLGLLALLLAACAPAATPTPSATPKPGTATPTLEPSRTPLRTATFTPTATAPPPATLNFNLLQSSTRGDKALSAPTGEEWEGDYTWAPYGLYHQGTYYLFYNGFQLRSLGIGLATSTDGFHYTRHPANPVFEPESGSTMAIGPVVYVDEDGRWIMYLVEDQHRSNLAGDSVMRYSAPAATGPWTADNDGQPVYTAPNDEHWTSRIVVRSIAFVEDEIWLAFHARHDDGSADIGILHSQDGLDFELLVDEPVISPGFGLWEETAVASPILFATEEGFEMFYIGLVQQNSGFLSSYEGNNLFFGYATSQDGIHWVKEPHNPVLQIPAAGGFSYSAGMQLEDSYYLYYVYDAGADGLGVAQLTIEDIE